VACDLDLLLTAKDCFLEGQVQVIAQVSPTARSVSSGCAKPKTPSKHLLKDLEGVSEAKVITKPSSTWHGVPETIVRCSLFRIGEHLVSLIEFLKAYLGIRCITDIGVPLASQLPICFFDLVLGRRTADSQDLVIIAPR
jgi:hypothetical protein